MSFPKYPEYKDSGVEWLGEVPAHWGVTPLKRLVKHITDKACASDFQVVLEHISGWTGRLTETDSEFSGDGIAFLPNDILFGKLRPYLAKAWCADRAGQAVGDFFVLRPKGICADFLHRYILAPAVIDDLNASTIGAKMPRVGWEDMSTLNVAVPFQGEQTQIARFLDHETARIDALIEEQQRLIELLKEKRQAVISHAVTKGLDPDVPMKDSGVEWLGEVPAHWAVERLKLSTESCQNGIWGNDAQSDENDVICIRVADFDRNRLRASLDNPTYRNVTAAEFKSRMVSQGDLLLEKSGGGEKQPVGFVVLYEDEVPAICANFIARIRLAAGMNPSFWRYVHAAGYSIGLNVPSIKQTSGIQNLDQHSYLNERAAFPPLVEQARIATFLDQETARIDALVKEAESAIELLQERRSALISAAVTGKIDVRGWQPPAGSSTSAEATQTETV